MFLWGYAKISPNTRKPFIHAAFDSGPGHQILKAVSVLQRRPFVFGVHGHAAFLIHLPMAATIIMAKLGLGIMLGLGPLFIAALMFPVTAKWFDKWFEQALAYILEIAITMVVVSVGVELFKALFDRVISTTTDNPISSFVQIIALALIIFFAQRKTSGLGARLAGGIAFDAVTFRSMAQGIGNVVNPKTTHRDVQSGMMVTAGRTNHMIAGNTMWNPAYRQHVLQNMGKNWGPATGGSVDGK
ncbi:type IV secretion system protein [Pusillimonas sp. NJUB218]|uniref:type IV secretion system protein n=1 Tax=Pusillimonas sp. NJUB218 TaxID=2023230 RepID=UPI001F1E4ABD|nr:type IV secretion system protein [Pusillimonas sp. NJUB218]